MNMDLSDQRRALLERLVRGAAPVRGTVAPADLSRTEPTSHAQARLWFLDHVAREDAAYVLHSLHRLGSALDPQVLERGVNTIVDRHEILRTTFRVRDGEPMQHIADRLHVPLHVTDLRHLPAERREGEAIRRLGESVAHGFDLASGPLLRTELCRLDECDWLFLLAVHHIVFDWPSFRVFFAELEAACAQGGSAASAALPPVKCQYRTFARSQREALTPARVNEDVTFWRAELDQLPALNLPLDRPRAAAPSFRGAARRLTVTPELTARLQRAASNNGATLFMVLLAGFSATMTLVCGQDDFGVGLPVTGRDSQDLQNAIGLYVDTLVLRARTHDNPTSEELIARTREAVYRSLAHRSLPFELMVQHLRPARELSMNPFFQVAFQLMQYPVAVAEGEGLELPRSGAMFDLAVDLWPTSNYLDGRVQFNTDLFDPRTIDMILQVFDLTLEWIAEPGKRLGELDMSAAGAPISVIHAEDRERRVLSPDAILSDAARIHHDRIAVEGSSDSISYGELMARVDALAAALSDSDVEHGSMIALALERSPELVLLRLAAWRAGAGFLCVDPSWPVERQSRILEDACPALVLRDAPNVTGNRVRMPREISSGDEQSAAYIIFTSGSTGGPKGVVINPPGLCNVIEAQREVFSLTPGRRVAMVASPVFDASIFEMVLALAAGATLVVAPPGILAGPELADFLTSRLVDAIVIPPSLLATLSPSDCPTLRLICVAGEACPAALADAWSDGREFWNLYGPTEATIWATYGRTRAGGSVSIGRPIANTSTLVVDSALRPVTRGVSGELCLAGLGLASGYLNRPDLTGRAFVPCERAPGGRIYRTGDLVRQTHDDELVFLGRVDRQIKVRGFRVEPEEIENVLRRHPSVRDAHVVARGSAGADVLVAYLLCDDNAETVSAACRQLVLQSLPGYMCPAQFVILRHFPRTSSGKVDAGAFPAPSETPLRAAEFVEPATETQRRVADLMSHILRVPRIGGADDFFDVGGHSLAAAQVVARAPAIFGVTLTIRDIFTYSTVSALAARIDEAKGEPGTDDDIPLARLPRVYEPDIEDPAPETRA